MKNIRAIQYDLVKKLYIDLVRFRGSEPNIADIEKLAREIIYSTDKTPLCGKYRLSSNKTVDVNSLNVEFGLIKADIETISKFSDEMQKRLRTSSFAAEIWSMYSSNRIKTAAYDMARLTSSSFINDFTTVLSMQDVIDTTNSTCVPDEDGSMCLPGIVSSTPEYTYRRSDIIVRPLTSALTADVYGNPTSILNPDETGSLTLSLRGSNVGETGFYIKIDTVTDHVNLLSITTGELRDGVKVTAYVTSDANVRTLIFNKITTNPKIDIPFDDQNIRNVELYLTMSNPNIISQSDNKYEFVINAIKLVSDKRKMSAVYQTREITLEEGTSYISLVTDESIIGAGSIKYYISTNKTTTGEPDGFVFVNTNSEDSLININVSSGNYVLSPEVPWSISPLFKYGYRLYNILDITGGETVDENECYSITSNTLLAKTGNVIDRNSIKLYRGSGDYLITEKNSVIDRNVEVVPVIPELNPDTEWIARIPLLVKVTEAVPVSSITSESGGKDNAVTVPFVIKSPESVKLTREDKTEIKSMISSITVSGNSTKIVFSGTSGVSLLNPSYKHSITYVITLEDYSTANGITIEIDPMDVDISVEGEALVYKKDFEVYSDTMEIELLKSGAYYRYYDTDDTSEPVKNLCSPAAVSYMFKGTYNQVIRYFETNVYCNVQTTVTVIPFSPAEVAAGNFHMVNGTYTGTQKSIILNSGWNSIKTTQPYPSLNDYDVNSLTLSRSNAGIILPDNVKIRPYLDSMRQVSPFTLINMDPVEGAKCFSYVDGEILISFKPESIDDVIVEDPLLSGAMGETFIGKKPIIDQYYKNTAWTSYPESFEIEFRYSDSTDKSVFVRAEIEIKNLNSVAKINKIGINQYK